MSPTRRVVKMTGALLTVTPHSSAGSYCDIASYGCTLPNTKASVTDPKAIERSVIVNKSVLSGTHTNVTITYISFDRWLFMANCCRLNVCCSVTDRLLSVYRLLKGYRELKRLLDTLLRGWRGLSRPEGTQNTPKTQRSQIPVCTEVVGAPRTH